MTGTGDSYLTRARVMTWHRCYTITIPKRIAEEMDLHKGEAVEVVIKKIVEGRLDD